MSDLLDARGVSKAFGATRVLAGVDFSVRAGEVHAVVGENGAGKSTLIRMLTGALRPDDGEVRFAGHPLPPDPRHVRSLGVSCVYQELALVPDMTVRDNIQLGQESIGLFESRQPAAPIADILRTLGATCDPGAVVRSLSVAEQQLVEIARALVTDARVLILDEPTAALSAPEVRRLLTVLRALRARGLGIVFVSHRFDDVFAIADRVTVLRDGRCVAATDCQGLTREQLIRWMVGRDITEEFPQRSSAAARTVLEVCDLSVDGRFANVSFAVASGEILGLAGLVGAGRTSVGLAIAGALPATGSVHLDGSPLRPRSPAEAIACGIAYVTEDRKARGLFPLMSVSENLTITYLREFARVGWLNRRAEEERARVLAAELQIPGVALDQQVRTLSGGTQQKVLLGRFLMKPRKVVILDEPTRGVDVGARAEIYRLINRITEQGVAVIMISSDLPELLGMADRILVMRNGGIAGELRRPEMTAERVMCFAAAG